MFARTIDLQEIDRRERTRRYLDTLLVLLTALSAIGAGLAMNAISSVGVFLGFLPV